MAACATAFVSCKDDEIVGTNDGEGFFLNRTELALDRGATVSLVATVTPKGADQVTWSSANPAVAEVSSEGVVTATGAGETVITAKAGSRSLECTVTVTSHVTSVTLDKASAEIWYGDELQLAVTAGPEDINVPMDTVWTSSNEAVAKVTSEGLVRAVGGGSATVAVKVNGVTASCELSVRRAPEGISLESPSDNLSAGRTMQLTARLVPEDATESLDFTWASDNESVATVDNSGLVTGVASGTANITVTSGEFSASKAISVKNPQQVTINLSNANSPFVSGDVTFTFSGNYGWEGNNYGVGFYTGSAVTISVPAGTVITQIMFNPTYGGGNSFSVNTGSYSRSGSSHSWTATEQTSSVTFSNSGSEVDVRTFTVNYE